MLVEIIPLETPSLGDRSYVVHDGDVALVVDPQRDIDRVLAVVHEAGVRVTHVLETHIHNDYVTGGLALAEATDAAYLVNADDEVGFARTPVRDGDRVEVSPRISVRAIATPGHTFTHLSYVLTADGREVAVFTGGSLLYGTTGRPDLLGPEHSHELAGHQYDSVHRLADEVPDAAQVLPTHGFGSFCASKQSEATESTIGVERSTNDAFSQAKDAWVEEMLAALDDHPAYYAHMAPLNAAGPGAADLEPPSAADKDEIRRRIEAGEWVLDLRIRTAYAAEHVRGSVNLGIEGDFVANLGWLLPWGAPLTLLGESAEQVATAQRDLARIGIDELAGAATGGPRQWSEGPLGHVEVASFADLAQVRHHRAVIVLDVRRDREVEQQHLEGSVHVPLHKLPDRVGEVPSGEVWVHCASGYRASVAASLLDARGHAGPLVVVDDAVAKAAAAGLAMVEPDDG